MTEQGVSENLVPGSRSEAIRTVYRNGWGGSFARVFGRTPEEYFAEYAHLEPDVWVCALRDVEAYAELERQETRKL